MASQTGLPFLTSSPIKNGKKTKAYKGDTVKERVLWMTRTSDVLGSHLNTTTEGFTTLIRRKIQERCGTTQELMSTIRRLKSGESGHVTPNEFRLTLLKFGINLPHQLISHIFNLFDTDRSGTIDFDEFAMWIMNSEFRPVSETDVAKLQPESYEAGVRRRLQESIRQNPKLFEGLKSKVDFLELISDTNRKRMPLSEKDVRTLFQILDEEETGLLDTSKLRRYAADGSVDTPPTSAKPFETPNLKQAIFRIVGKNAHLLAKAFSHVPSGAGVKMTFDEFKRTIQSEDLVRNPKAVENLFLALGGNRGKADIDLLLNSLEFLQDDPRTVASKKTMVSREIPFSRADRTLRDSMRKSFKQVQSTLELCDPRNTGYVDPLILHKVLNNLCVPLSFQDFRYVTQNVQANEDGFLNWGHFLNMYNPATTSHVLSGPLKDVTVPLPHSSSTSLIHTNTSNDDLSDMTFHANFTLDGNGKNEHSNDSAALRDRQNEARKLYKHALKKCISVDTERTGFVDRITFLDSLRDLVGKLLTAEDVLRLTEKYEHGGGEIDYHMCFRTCLNDVMGRKSTSSVSSKFELAPVSKSRSLKSMHPWEFGYHKNEDEIPYWTRATQIPKERPSTMSSLDAFSMGRSANGLSNSRSIGKLAHNAEMVEKLLKSYDARTISICKKVANFSGFKEFCNDMKRAQINLHKGCISTDNMIALITQHQVPISKGECGTLFRVYRTLGMSDVFSFKEFVDTCYAAKNVGDV